MKKLVSGLLVLLILCALIPAGAEESPVGMWKITGMITEGGIYHLTDEDGIIILIIYGNGTAEMKETYPDRSTTTSGYTWSPAASGYVVEYSEKEVYNFTLRDGEMVLNQGDLFSYILVRISDEGKAAGPETRAGSSSPESPVGRWKAIRQIWSGVEIELSGDSYFYIVTFRNDGTAELEEKVNGEIVTDPGYRWSSAGSGYLMEQGGSVYDFVLRDGNICLNWNNLYTLVLVRISGDENASVPETGTENPAERTPSGPETETGAPADKESDDPESSTDASAHSLPSGPETETVAPAEEAPAESGQYYETPVPESPAGGRKDEEIDVTPENYRQYFSFRKDTSSSYYPLSFDYRLRLRMGPDSDRYPGIKADRVSVTMDTSADPDLESSRISIRSGHTGQEYPVVGTISVKITRSVYESDQAFHEACEKAVAEADARMERWIADPPVKEIHGSVTVPSPTDPAEVRTAALKEAAELIRTDDAESWSKAKKLLEPFRDDPAAGDLYRRIRIGTLDGLSAFYDDVAVYAELDQNNRFHWGLLRADGVFLTEPVYSWIGNGSDFVAASDEMIRTQDSIVHRLTLNSMDGVDMFSNGLVSMQREDDPFNFYGYLNTEGKEVIPCRFFSRTEFCSKYALVWDRDNKPKIIDAKGKTVASLPAGRTYYCAGPELVLCGENTLLGFVSLKGKTKVKPQYSKAYLPDGNGNNVVVSTKGKSGLVNQKGKLVVKCEYDTVQNFGSGKYLLGTLNQDGQGYQYTLVNKNGKILKKKGFTLNGFGKISQTACLQNGYAIAVSPEGKYCLFDGSLNVIGTEDLPFFTDSSISFTVSVVSAGECLAFHRADTDESHLYSLSGGVCRRLTGTPYREILSAEHSRCYSAKTKGGVWDILDRNGNSTLK